MLVQSDPRGDAGLGPSLSPPGCPTHLWGALSPALASSPQWRASLWGWRAVQQPCPSSQARCQLQGYFLQLKTEGEEKKRILPELSLQVSALWPCSPLWRRLPHATE